jgi:hypothetical protein
MGCSLADRIQEQEGTEKTEKNLTQRRQGLLCAFASLREILAFSVTSVFSC